MSINASWFEVAFVAVTASGVTANLWCLRDVLEDSRVLRANGRADELSVLIANGNIRAEVVTLLMQAPLLGFGLLSLMFPAATNSQPVLDGGVWLYRAVVAVRIGFFVGTSALVVNSLMSVRERRRILKVNGKHG